MKKSQLTKKYFNQRKALSLKNPKYLGQVQWLVEHFLREDLADVGDITTEAMIKENKKATATMTAKATGVIAGIEEVVWIAKAYNIRVTKHIKDGESVKKGTDLLTLKGNIKELLILERTVLNVMQRMSGIATHTKQIVEKAKGDALICATRKTHWGLLDKKAVALGGGGTHRLGLYDFVLVKDNHIAFAGDKLDDRLTELKVSNQFWEIEAKTARQVKQFVAYNPSVIMLDNFTPAQIKKILASLDEKTKASIIFEASGGITEKNVAGYAKSGVDVISLGALTHSVTSLDISLNIA